MKIRIGFIIIAFIIASCSLMLTDFYELGEIADLHVYFYDDHFIVSSSECFLQDGEVMYYRNIFDSQVYLTIGVFFLGGVFSVVLIIGGWVLKLLMVLFRKRGE